MPILFFGLRAAEPCYLFAEYLEDAWLRVPCNTDLGYRTKGRRDKRFPLLDELQEFWQVLRGNRSHGLLFESRRVAEGRERPKLRAASLVDLVTEYRHRCAGASKLDAKEKERLRDRVLRDAGAMNYDQLQGEFNRIARKLQWPVQATLKDLRHLFATTMNNALMPEAYRRYLMGQSPGKAAIVAYTHLNELQRHYADAVRREWKPLIATIQNRLKC